ncbi:MAG: hypothetical protein PHY43_15695 [Verrucomicrobiales bacterium]|nr:hypothetical protein [Verrucomicrobiales bacterium]
MGVEHRLYQEYGRAPRGERLYAEVWPCLGFVDYCGAHKTWMF